VRFVKVNAVKFKKLKERSLFMSMKFLKSFIAVIAALVVTSTYAVASEIDKRIESSFKESFVYKTYLKGDDIKTTSTDGRVILAGTVAEESHKSLAKETAALLPGVKSVDDQLVLKGEKPAENSDAWIGMKVKTVLLFHRNVNVLKTEVGVKDGVVTLNGEANSQAQKDLASEYAKDVSGVLDVKNEMTIVKDAEKSGKTMSEMIDDASITAQVKMALMFHQSTSALNTKVETSDGVVTVSGIAKNDAEKALVSKLASDINGVTKVINTVTIS
jgi:osmotically-inducible protein OsmY